MPSGIGGDDAGEAGSEFESRLSRWISIGRDLSTGALSLPSYIDQVLPDSDGGRNDRIAKYIGENGFIKVGKMALALVGGIFLAIVTVPIRMFLTVQNQVIRTLEAGTGWFLSLLDRLTSEPIETFAATIPQVRQFVDSLGIFALPAGALLALVFWWIYRRWRGQ